jgi:cytochrome b pre-mRNA-processing protein 3
MLRDKFFKPDPIRQEAARLLAVVNAAARQEDLYGPERTPDTFDGRFQLLSLYAALAMRRLRATPEAAKLGQEFSDALFQSFDDGLREAGVGDLAVPKQMKKIAKAFYGRLAAYDAALTAQDAPALAGVLSRNIWDVEDAPFAAALARRVGAVAARLGAVAPEGLAEAQLWQG